MAARAWLLISWLVAAGNATVQIGIATFDTTVHFYTLQASQSQAQMLVMPDVEDVYSVSSTSVVVPLQPSLELVSCFFSACEANQTLQALLRTFPSLLQALTRICPSLHPPTPVSCFDIVNCESASLCIPSFEQLL